MFAGKYKNSTAVGLAWVIAVSSGILLIFGWENEPKEESTETCQCSEEGS